MSSSYFTIFHEAFLHVYEYLPFRNCHPSSSFLLPEQLLGAVLSHSVHSNSLQPYGL